MKHSLRQRCYGMTLLETLALVAVLAVLINICGTAFVSAARLNSYCSKLVDRQKVLSDLKHDYSEAVHEALRVVPELGRFRTGTDQLVLELAPRADAPDVRRYVVMGKLTDKPDFVFHFIDDTDGRLSPHAIRSYDVAGANAAFEYGSDETIPPSAVSLTLFPPEGAGDNAVTHRFVAAPRSRGTLEKTNEPS